MPKSLHQRLFGPVNHDPCEGFHVPPPGLKVRRGYEYDALFHFRQGLALHFRQQVHVVAGLIPAAQLFPTLSYPELITFYLRFDAVAPSAETHTHTTPVCYAHP
jgi:hypothetical protein